MRILITGSRAWTDRAAIRRALANAGGVFGAHPQEVTIVHGGARGAEFGCRVEVHPADWPRHGKAAGHRRNAEMVALGADVCLAFPLGESRGTRDCVRRARDAGIPVVEHAAVAT